MGLGPRSANPRLGGPFLADAAHDAITTPLAPPSEPALLGDAPPATPAPGPTLLDEQPPPAPGPTLLDDRVRPMQPPAPQPVWQQRADLHLGAAHQRPPGWPPVPQPRPADRPPDTRTPPRRRWWRRKNHRDPGCPVDRGRHRRRHCHHQPAATRTRTALRSRCPPALKHREPAYGPQVTLPFTGLFPGVWRWIPPATSTSPTAPTIGW